MTYKPRINPGRGPGRPKGTPSRPFTAEEDARVKQLFLDGHKPHQIAAIIERASSNIYRRLRIMDLIPPEVKAKPMKIAEGPTCTRCTVILAATPRPATDGRCCWCTEEGHTS